MRAATRPWRSASTASQTCASSERSLESKQHAAAARGKIAEQGVDLRLGRYVDPLRRLVQQQHFNSPRQPFGENDFLLIAAGQRRDFQVRPARTNVEQAPSVRLPGSRPARRSRQPMPCRRPRLGSRMLSRDRLVHHQAESARRPAPCRCRLRSRPSGLSNAGRAFRRATTLAARAVSRNSAAARASVPLPSSPQDPRPRPPAAGRRRCAVRHPRAGPRQA